MLPGPCLNSKLLTSLMLLRFDKLLLTFDIKKAFLNIELYEEDQNRLLFLWYRSVNSNDYSLVGYKNLRLPFGLRPSLCMLMVALYKILVLDSEKDSIDMKSLKRAIYHLIYMDNGGITSE